MRNEKKNINLMKVHFNGGTQNTNNTSLSFVKILLHAYIISNHRQQEILNDELLRPLVTLWSNVMFVYLYTSVYGTYLSVTR